MNEDTPEDTPSLVVPSTTPQPVINVNEAGEAPTDTDLTAHTSEAGGQHPLIQKIMNNPSSVTKNDFNNAIYHITDSAGISREDATEVIQKIMPSSVTKNDFNNTKNDFNNAIYGVTDRAGISREDATKAVVNELKSGKTLQQIIGPKYNPVSWPSKPSPIIGVPDKQPKLNIDTRSLAQRVTEQLQKIKDANAEK